MPQPWVADEQGWRGNLLGRRTVSEARRRGGQRQAVWRRPKAGSRKTNNRRAEEADNNCALALSRNQLHHRQILKKLTMIIIYKKCFL
jgi:hypothetical protein